MTWTYDHPSGAYKNHALSSQIRLSALQRTFFPRFMRPERGFGKARGETVNVTRILQLSKAGRITEQDNIPKATPAISTIGVTVSPWGIKIETTEFEESLTHYNLRSQHQRLLRNNIQLTLDALGAETLVKTPIKVIPTAANPAVFDTDGVPTATADANVTVATLRACKDDLTKRKIPPFANGKYVGAFTYKAARGLKNDAETKAWLAPNTVTPFQSGSVGAASRVPGGETPMAEFIGTIENIDCYETNNTDVLSDAKGTAGILGEAVIFGDDAMCLAQVMAPELRAGIPYELGTKRDVGWVGTLECGLIWPEASLSRVIHITSA